MDAWKRGQTSRDFDLNAGRRAFKDSDTFDSAWGWCDFDQKDCADEQAQTESMVRQSTAMRSFTDSIDVDIPPKDEEGSFDLPLAPELPASLDIDLQPQYEEQRRLNEALRKMSNDYDVTLGETQKYQMTVPGPGHVDAEMEVHKSLLQQQDSLENGVDLPPLLEPLPSSSSFDRRSEQFQDLRQECVAAAVARPRPTTPTSWCAIENYVEHQQPHGHGHTHRTSNEPPDAGARMRVCIPGQETTGMRKRKDSMSWSDFYETMAAQIPPQVRSGSALSGRATPMNDYEGDILDENPAYRNRAPPPPAEHRRLSVDWEPFEDGNGDGNGDGRRDDVPYNMDDVEKVSREHDRFGTKDEIMDNSNLKHHQAVPTQTPPSSPTRGASSTDFDAEAVVRRFSIGNDDQQAPAMVENVADSEFQKKVKEYDHDHDLRQSKEYDDHVPEPNVPEYQTDWNESSTQPGQGHSYDYGSDQHTQPGQGYSYGHGSDQHTQPGQGYSDDYGSDQHTQPGQGYSDDYGSDQHTQPGQGYSYDHGSDQHTQPGQGYSYDHGSNQHTQPGYSEQSQYGNYQSDPAYDYNYEQQYQPTEQEYPQNTNYGNEQQGQSEATNNMYPYSYDYDAQRQPSSELAQSINYNAVDAGDRIPLTAIDDRSAYSGYDYQNNAVDASDRIPLNAIDDRSAYRSYGYSDVDAGDRIPLTATDDRSAYRGYGYPPNEPVFSGYDKSYPTPNRPPPPPPQFMAPLLPELNRRGPIDPFSWEAQETEEVPQRTIASHIPTMETNREISNESTPSRPAPPRPPPVQQPKRPPPPRPSPTAPVAVAVVEEAVKEEDAWSAFKRLTDKTTSAVKTTEDKLKELSETSATKNLPDRPFHVQRREDSRSPSPPSFAKRTLAEQESNSLDDHLQHFKHTDDTRPIGDRIPEQKESARVEAIGSWAGFDDQTLPPSESGFFSRVTTVGDGGENTDIDPFTATQDAFNPVDELLIEQNYDPFDVRPVDEVFAAAKARADAEAAAAEAADDLDFFSGGAIDRTHLSAMSTPTPEGGSPASSRPVGFEDAFHPADEDMHTPTPLYDEDDSEPLMAFPAKFTDDGWDLMIRYPLKKKIVGDRYWKPCFVRLYGNALLLYGTKQEQKPFQEIPLQASYSMSETSLQAYDVYGKIHTTKLQYVVYKERVGIRAGQISRLVEGHLTKYGLPLEHAAQCTVIVKFGCLIADHLATFVNCIEDLLFHAGIRRDSAPVHKIDEVQIHCYDEYSAHVDKQNVLSDQKARVRLFCLAFISGSPLLEIGLNDRRRQGKEVVRRKDILPMYTERWIRFENLEFHQTVDEKVFENEQVIRLAPPDGVFFEIMRFRIRPPRNREKPLSVRCIMKMAGSKVEIRLEAMVAGSHDPKANEKRGVPCEDIQIRFPIPEAWIYLFREDRHWGVGSVHAKIRKPGRVKNLKDRLMGAVQHTENSLIEAAVGEAKYEHVYRALVWRIPRLPEKQQQAYKEHLLKCRFELSSFDLMPDTFLPTCDVDFTMPLATVSNMVVRSVSVEQHEDSDRVEKFVRYVAKFQYKVEIDYVQCADLDVDAILDPTNLNPEIALNNVPEQHKPMFEGGQVSEPHEGYRIDFSDAEVGHFDRKRDSSSEDEEEERKKGRMPIIQIDMKGYGY